MHMLLPVHQWLIKERTMTFQLMVQSLFRPATSVIHLVPTRFMYVLKFGLLFAFGVLPLLSMASRFSTYILKLQSATLRAEYYIQPFKHETPIEPFDRIVHQIWNDNSTIPKKWRKSSRSCVQKGIGYRHKLWTHSEIRHLIETEYPWLLQTYLSYDYDIQRVDVAKYLVLYHLGGIYVDLDIVCKYKWDDLLANFSHYGVLMAESTPVGVATDTLVAKRQHPFFKYALSSLDSANKWRVVPYATIMFGTGPMFLSTCLMEYSEKHEIYVIPHKVYSEQWFGNLHGGSWHQWDGMLFYWVFTHRIAAFFLGLVLILLVWGVYRIFSRYAHSKGVHASNTNCYINVNESIVKHDFTIDLK